MRDSGPSVTFLLAISAVFPGLLVTLLNRNMISGGYIQGEVEMDCLLLFSCNVKVLKIIDILTIL